MPQTHPHVTTWAGRKFYGEQVNIPTGAQTATASNPTELQNAINNPANVVIEVDGNCGNGSTINMLASHSGAGQKRYIVGKAGAFLAKIVMFGAFNWVFTADGTTTDWLDFGSAKGNYTYNGQNYAAGTVFGGISCVNVKDVVIDRWRFRDAAGFLSYYNTDGSIVENLVVQRGNHRNTDTDNPREAVLISRPAWNGEMIGGSGNTLSTNKWAVRSVGVKLVNNISANAPDWYQNTGNGHISGSPNGPDWAWAWGIQTGAGSLSDEGMIIAGNQLWCDEYVYNERGLPIRAKATENPLDLKNGSADPDNPILIFDNIFYGWAPGRGQGDGDGVTLPKGHLVDPGTGINLHYEESQNIKVYDNIFAVCNRGIFTGKGYSKAIHIQHNLFYNGPATLNGTPMHRFNTAHGQNAEPFGIMMQEHTGGGEQRCDYNHLMYQRVAFSQNVRNGDPPPSCIGNVALGGGGWIGALAGMAPQECIADKSGFGTQVDSDVLNRCTDLNIEVRDPNNLDDPNATVILSMPGALLAPSDAPTNENRWIAGNEAAPGLSADGFELSGAGKNTKTTTAAFTLQATGGTEPYTYELLGNNNATASVSLAADVLTVQSNGEYGSVTATVRASDADGETDTAAYTVYFERPQIPDITWTTNSEPDPSAPVGAINDGDLSFNGGWIGNTAETAPNPVEIVGTWPVPHDVQLMRTMEALDHIRRYYRHWDYTTDGVTWQSIAEFGQISEEKTEPLQWTAKNLTITNVIGVRRLATGNSDPESAQWQRVTEVELYGVPSVASLTPPTCDGYTVNIGQGETVIITPEDVATLADTDGGDTLSFDAAPLSISPADAGVVSLNTDGNIELSSADDYAGDIALICQVRATEGA